MQTNNYILAALPERVRRRLRSKLETVVLEYNTDIYAAGSVITDVYFPESGIVSLVAVIDERSSIEVVKVGNEGMVGLPLFLGVKTSFNRAVVQAAGVAKKMTAADFVHECEAEAELAKVLQRFAHSRMVQVSQSAVCSCFHPVEARLAHWLLMTRDRMDATEFKITQKFLANLLGVRREAVNKATNGFQDRGLIRCDRGSIKILDEQALIAFACKCYEILQNEFPKISSKRNSLETA